MAFAAAITDQFKQDILNGVHQPGDTYKIALYTQAGATDKNKSVTVYNTTGELATAGGYTQGGATLAGFTVGLSTDTAYITFTNPSWASASFTADCAVIYNSSRSNKILAVISITAVIPTSCGMRANAAQTNAAASGAATAQPVGVAAASRERNPRAASGGGIASAIGVAASAARNDLAANGDASVLPLRLAALAAIGRPVGWTVEDEKLQAELQSVGETIDIELEMFAAILMEAA